MGRGTAENTDGGGRRVIVESRCRADGTDGSDNCGTLEVGTAAGSDARGGRDAERKCRRIPDTDRIADAVMRKIPPRRIYPRWLPPTPAQRIALLQIRRMQRNVMIWLVAFIPAGWVVIALTRSDVMLVPFSVLWLAAGIALARRVTEMRCPRCAESFCEKSEMPYWYGLLNHHCQSCGLTLARDDDSPQ